MHIIGRRIGSLLGAVLAAATLVAVAPTAAVGATVLCSGVSTRDVAKCDSGWAANMHFMHWRMYSGHNCTNYVAYRLKRDGVPMPSYRLGNADTWAPNAKRNGVRVDSTPTVGAVGAWPGRRHIVYVDQVGSNYLIISEDNWPGYYPKGMYRKLKVFKGERGYPTQFIHFKGKSTINGPVPKVDGAPKVGETLTAKAGTWTPSGVSLDYQWLRDGFIIKGADERTYKLTTNDVGHRMSISITGAKSGYASRTASSEPTAKVAGGAAPPKPPEDPDDPSAVQGSTPTISGDPRRGRYLTADTGDWGPSGVALTYEWLRGDDVVASGTTRYKVRSTDLGGQLTFRVKGTKKSLTSTTKTSKPTDTVRATSTLTVTPETGQGTAVLGVVVSVSNAPTPAGFVTVHEGSRKLKRNDLSIGRPGRATLRLELAKGTHTLTVSYGGDGTTAPSTATVTVKVS
ncbi:CHAP domain-containing protein [Aeromicrobium sp.]|uniref:CHAP domain-containing protein n=1 Tax=Aeromicrobium sp. TaxID=1871063 RepID=UPI003D6B1112